MLRGMVKPWPRTCTVHCYQDLFDSFPTPPATLTHLGGLLLAGFFIVWALPTSQAITRHIDKVRGTAVWVISGALLFCIALLAIINASHHSSEFIYFNF